VIFLSGEWPWAWGAMSLAFLVAALGVVGLGWWVLRADARNRAGEESAQAGPGEHKEAHH
jgi:hypothetical protein